MTAHPKQKITKANKGKRRSHNALSAPNLVVCPQCSELMKPHQVCKACGYYGGKNVLNKAD